VTDTVWEGKVKSEERRVPGERKRENHEPHQPHELKANGEKMPGGESLRRKMFGRGCRERKSGERVPGDKCAGDD
jgi:hypothetical protein